MHQAKEGLTLVMETPAAIRTRALISGRIKLPEISPPRVNMSWEQGDLAESGQFACGVLLLLFIKVEQVPSSHGLRIHGLSTHYIQRYERVASEEDSRIRQPE